MSITYNAPTVTAIPTNLATLRSGGIRAIIAAHLSASSSTANAEDLEQGKKPSNLPRVIARASDSLDNWTAAEPVDNQTLLNQLTSAQTILACYAQALADAAATILANQGSLHKIAATNPGEASTGTAARTTRTWP